MRPDNVGSSEKDSKARPPSGERWMLMVGARRQTAPRALVSAASRPPAEWTSSVEKVEATQVAFGSAEARAGC
jgi:hypothetical protein